MYSRVVRDQAHRWRAVWIIVAVLVVVVMALAGYALAGPILGLPGFAPSTTRPATPVSPTRAQTTGPTAGDVRALLDSIPVKGRASYTGYDGSRAYWGMWDDTDGCSTRNLILARDLTQVAYRGHTSCVVNSGLLLDPYTGTIVDFQYGAGPGQSDAIQIDHVVSRQNAWVTGASAWTAEQRYAFANDPLNLLAVGTAVNQAKGSGDAATWLPPNQAFRCQYVSLQVQVKAKYGLWMTRAEHDAMASVLTHC